VPEKRGKAPRIDGNRTHEDIAPAKPYEVYPHARHGKYGGVLSKA
jgi:hypothetical protein